MNHSPSSQFLEFPPSYTSKLSSELLFFDALSADNSESPQFCRVENIGHPGSCERTRRPFTGRSLSCSPRSSECPSPRPSRPGQRPGEVQVRGSCARPCDGAGDREGWDSKRPTSGRGSRGSSGGSASAKSVCGGRSGNRVPPIPPWRGHTAVRTP